MSGYLIVALLLNQWRFNKFEHQTKGFINHIFDGATFALSLALFVGVFDPNVLTLLGSTKVFLMIAGLAGIGYGIRSLF